MKSTRNRLRKIVKKHHPEGIKKMDVLGFNLVIYPSVFMPNGVSSEIFRELLNKIDSKFDHVLDLGCGSGILSLILSKFSNKVIATDINKNAIKSTKLNAKLNNVSNIKVRLSNLFSKIPEKFDLIIFNPPFMDLKPYNDIEIALTDHKHKNLIKFFEDVKAHLTPEGKIIMDFSDMGDEKLLDKLIESHKFSRKILNQTKIKDFAGVDTTISVFELRSKN